MCVFPVSDSIFVQITFNFLDHFDLLSLLIEGNRERISSSEEDFENFEGIPIEAVSLDLPFPVCT